MMETSDNSPGASVRIAKWSRNALGKEERFYSQSRVGDCRMDMWSASQRRFSRVLKDDFWVAHGSLVVRAWLTPDHFRLMSSLANPEADHGFSDQESGPLLRHRPVR